MTEIDFLQMPADRRDPGQYIEFDNRNAKPGLSTQPHRILYLGQMLDAGTATPLVAVQIFSGDAEAQALFGRGSMLASMWAAGGKVDKTTERWAMALPDLEAGVAAAGAYKFTAATGAGLIPAMIGGRYIRSGVAAGDDAPTIATNFAAAVNADLDCQVTAAVNGVDTTKVDLTARHKGEEGNNILLAVNYYDGDALPAGVEVTITAMTGGVGNPDITDALAALGPVQYHSFIMPYNDAANRAALETELAARSGPLKQIEALAYAAKRATAGNLATYGLSRNTEFTSTFGEFGMIDTPWERAAAYGAACAFACRVDPAQPLQTVPLPGQKPARAADRFEPDERDLLLHDGIAMGYVDDGGVVRIRRAITNYRANAWGLPDDSYLDSETLRILFFLRFDTRSLIAQKFPRSKLADNGTRGKGVHTPNDIRDQINGRAAFWEAGGIIEDLPQFRRDLIVVRNGQDPSRVDARIPANVINGLRIFAGQIQFIL